MKKLSSYEIRKMWLDFFASKGHQVMPSASLVPVDDPTLLWINAGIAPLKKYFDGREIPTNRRLTNAQKSLRTNDIENVGKTARHHTFFEMLGNFSVGDYFRDEAIEMATELLFSEKWFGLDRNLIYITYYPDDHDTFNRWVACGMDPTHLIPLEGNFWEIGEGPCGPDTEIFFDRGEKYDPEGLGIKMLQEEIENDRYIEIWNIVLSQFNSKPGVPRSEYKELPSKNIDTGSGLERLTCIFQGTETNYETDLFLPLIKYLEDNCNYRYENSDFDVKMAFRVIVDHVRTVTFAVADGATLSNEGRGYVLRRILRRAIRYGRKLGINRPFLHKMVSVVVDNMKDYYDYLVEKKSIIEKIIKIEEDAFFKTLEAGEKKLQDIISKTKGNRISGEDAFLLYDTFGFPIELTIEACEEAKLTVDIDGFNHALQLQKERARNARNDQQSMNIQNEDFLKFKELSEFTGYHTLKNESKIVGLFKDGKKVSEARGLVYVVLDKTPFYAMSGGQVGDQGSLIVNNMSLPVYDTFKLPNKQHAHVVEAGDVTLHINDNALAEVDEAMRFEIACNHSATHLLNQALREVLGNHVVQQGSQVNRDSLRFDFNHYENLTIENILEIEKIVNQQIARGNIVKITETTLEEAKKVGAQAEFGEKYGAVVRLVDMDFSKELCGGTHVSNTSVINRFAIGSIESKGSGIFRIEASTNVNAIGFIHEKVANMEKEIYAIVDKMNELVSKAKNKNITLVKPRIQLPEVKGSYQDILNYRNTYEEARKILKELDKQFEKELMKQNQIDFHDFMSEVKVINGTNVLLKVLENQNMDAVKKVIDDLAIQYENCLIFFALINGEKVIFIAKSKGNNYHCGEIVKLAAMATGGNGGGRPDFAQAGGRDITKVNDAMKVVLEKVN